MGLLNRVSVLIQSKVMSVVDRVEDPRETLSVACQRQEDLLAGVRRSLVDVTASRHQLAAQITRLEQRLPQLDDQAERAVRAGRDDLARQALGRRKLAEHQAADLKKQLEEVRAEELKLQTAERRFAASVDGFRTKRDLLSARYTAAEAQYEAQRSLAGLSGELADPGQGVQRAEEKIERMRARAAAIDELLGSGGLDNLSGDEVEEQLRRYDDEQEIAQRLEELKAKQRNGEEL